MGICIAVWLSSVVFGLIIYLAVAKRIENSGKARLGATGNLFTCDPKTDSK